LLTSRLEPSRSLCRSLKIHQTLKRRAAARASSVRAARRTCCQPAGAGCAVGQPEFCICEPRRRNRLPANNLTRPIVMKNALPKSEFRQLCAAGLAIGSAFLGRCATLPRKTPTVLHEKVGPPERRKNQGRHRSPHSIGVPDFASSARRFFSAACPRKMHRYFTAGSVMLTCIT
jgi:hypothetical protein